jgi:hypothetical protein
VLLEELGVQVRQLDGVADLLDLAHQPADVGVVDVRHLFEDQLLDLGLGDALVDVVGAGVEQDGVAGAQRRAAKRCRDPHDALLVGVRDHQGPVAVGQDLLQHHDLADLLELESGDDVEGLVEHDLLAALQLLGVDVGADVDPQLAAAGEDVDGPVVVGREVGPEAGRRLGEPVDLLLEGHDLVAGLAQGRHQALVLRGQGRDGGLHVGEALLEEPGRLRRVEEPSAQLCDLCLEVADLASELVGRHRAPT